ncbi:hypothetical protein [Nonomuraea sp. NPDC002799]
MTATTGGTVYLLHFTQPYKHARHYIGWTAGNLTRRLRQHRNRRGARLLQVITAAGIDFMVARTWTGGRNLERSLKRRGGASRSCPLCGITPRVTGWDLPTTDLIYTAEHSSPYEITFVDAVCACHRVVSIAETLLASASITCGDCFQPLTRTPADT